jgi:uncharacterized protein (DUF433 family)
MANVTYDEIFGVVLTLPPLYRVILAEHILKSLDEINLEVFMNTISVSKEHIVITPGVCGGKPRIAGHRIKVQDIVIWHERMGMSPDEIIYQHPSITLADVYAALAYYHDHREEIRQQIEEGENFAKQLQGNNPSLIEKILKGESVKQD